MLKLKVYLMGIYFFRLKFTFQQAILRALKADLSYKNTQGKANSIL